jgi:hypothetical protein
VSNKCLTFDRTPESLLLHGATFLEEFIFIGVRDEVATFIEEFIGVRDEVQVQTLSELSWSEEDAMANAREIRGKGRCQFATAITAPARQAGLKKTAR